MIRPLNDWALDSLRNLRTVIHIRVQQPDELVDLNGPLQIGAARTFAWPKSLGLHIYTGDRNERHDCPSNSQTRTGPSHHQFSTNCRQKASHCATQNQRSSWVLRVWCNWLQNRKVRERWPPVACFSSYQPICNWLVLEYTKAENVALPHTLRPSTKKAYLTHDHITVDPLHQYQKQKCSEWTQTLGSSTSIDKDHWKLVWEVIVFVKWWPQMTDWFRYLSNDKWCKIRRNWWKRKIHF